MQLYRQAWKVVTQGVRKWNLRRANGNVWQETALIWAAIFFSVYLKMEIIQSS
jgi:hypothetical protein